MSSAEEHEAMVGLFEDKIMEMVRRRVGLQLLKGLVDGKVTISAYLIDHGRDGTAQQGFAHSLSSVSIEAEMLMNDFKNSLQVKLT